MAQHPLQMPPDQVWEADEALCREAIAQKARAVGGIYRQALQPGLGHWEEDYLRFSEDLRVRAVADELIHTRAVEQPQVSMIPERARSLGESRKVDGAGS